MVITNMHTAEGTVYRNNLRSYVISRLDLIMGLSRVVDLVNPFIDGHHQRVAYIAGVIARECGLPENDVNDIVSASALHDIGVVAEKEFKELANPEFSGHEYGHGYVGHLLFRDTDCFGSIASMIRYHHEKWNHGKAARELGSALPEGALIIHLADRVDILTDRNRTALEQKAAVIDKISSMKGRWFKPAHVDAFLHAAEKESFWFNLEEPDKYRLLKRGYRFNTLILGQEEILEISKLISRIIDFRCSFTSTHSAGVAKSASLLAEICGMDAGSVRNMEVAGYLHDLGKLAVLPDVLYKNGALNISEQRMIKKHTYYTYYALNCFEIFDHIKEWASFHHETLDGNGYPFHVKGDRLDLGCRIMAVADIFTALTEDRPYRAGMDSEGVISVLDELAEKNKIDARVVAALKDNYTRINTGREEAQAAAAVSFREFLGNMQGKGIELYLDE
ncbi:HD domain-containing protein [Geovibrio thiophilus]|uniref:HD domain-containing protein n=1 Tax=Geovibrio thiophilus TaxID=139438 RepID=A0A410JWH6_9BACT|nr:HD domain-containing phosphohydrolase [Geovibrio thiophilus]QAR32546.1 HD domain-containing protein [Geovibrio thiophilus]